jgi:hypothetical protein
MNAYIDKALEIIRATHDEALILSLTRAGVLGGSPNKILKTRLINFAGAVICRNP